MFDFWRRKRIYLDYASAPRVLPEAIASMREAEAFVGNPGAIHAEGVAAKRSLEDSRARIAALLGCKARELILTSGLTESNNLAILGFAKHLGILRSDLKGSQSRTLENTHWLVSSIEHDSVLDCFAEVERLGGSVSHLNPSEDGIFLPERLAASLRKETVCVSIGWANNELGTIQPLPKLARVIRAHEKEHGTAVAFHSDAGQGPLYLPTVVSTLGVDLLSLGANKLHGPHGIGALYVSNRVALSKVMLGGAHERGLRAGTENVALAAGFAAAFKLVASERARESKRLRSLRDALAKELVANIPGLVINGELKETLPHMLNVSIPNVSSEYVTLSLDAKGIAISTKSACREGEASRSHVVAAFGGEEWRAENTFRFSLGRGTSAADIRRVVSVLADITRRP